MTFQRALELYSWHERNQAWIRRIVRDRVYRPGSFTGWQQSHRDAIEATERHLNMTKKKARTKATWKAFANIDIPSHEQDIAKEVILNADLTVERISDLVSQGYKLSVSYNSDTDTFIATLTGAYADLKNAGLSVSGFGKDWVIALGSVAYKHFDVANGDWTTKVSKSADLFG